MEDIPPLGPCPVGKAGRHTIGTIVPSDVTYETTFYCEECGAIRRVPSVGHIRVGSLDDLPPGEIEALVSPK